jgi:uncharacterized membrane protein YeaQ/YmgE (transglycosylase-associated protein family)
MAMRRRLYFLLPDVPSAKRTADDLLLARVDDRRMHFLAKRGTDLGELHEASYTLKTDLGRGAWLGLVLGALGGALVGALLVGSPLEGTQPGATTALVATLVGAVLGIWLGSMAAVAVPNSRLRAFQPDLERGSVLLMVDVAYGRVDEVRDIVRVRHPEAMSAGLETRYPAFP